MADISELSRGTQVVYVPDHADGRLDHPNSEEGFVTSVRTFGGDGSADIAFCRFWSKYHDGLRTKANSEACFARHLVVKDTRDQTRVDQSLAQIEREDSQCLG
jgi:hypothetical protein